MQDLTLDEIGSMSRTEAENAIRARSRSIYLGQRTVLSRVLGRQKLFLATDDLGFAGNVMLDGYWEIWLTQFFARYLKRGMTVVDVGANFGYYTCLFGDAVGCQGRVLAVEPVPATADLLWKSIQLNGHTSFTQLERVALGRDASGDVHILIPHGEPKNATVVGAAGPGTIVVPTTTLDVLAADFARIDLVKIDAEGAEADILAGMHGVIQKHAPAVMLEFNAARYADAAEFLGSLRRQFSSIRKLDFNGDLQAVSDADVLGTQVGEDWLLFLEVHR